MDANDAEKALASVQLARDHARLGRHGAATANLMQALQVVPQLAEELEGELTFSLKAYGEHLAAIGQPSKAFWLYSQAIPLLPRPRGLHANLGALQYSLGQAAASIESFQRALALDPGYWPALESLENVKSSAVDRWHFRMLNHSARNEAYSRAIQRAVTAAAASDKNRHNSKVEGVTVLDIGTGTGILAVMAAKAGAAHVYACEVNGVLVDIAKEVVERNGVADRVTVIHKSSGALEPGVDLPERGVDVIVTELVDSGLLGERIIPVLTDARARGLLATGGRVIPEGARVYAAVLESDVVRRRSRLLPGSPMGLSTTAVCPTNEDPYTCEDLERVEHQLLTTPTAVLEVDFLRDGAALLVARSATAPPTCSTTPTTTQLRVIRSGHADAVAVWFDLWLDAERGVSDVVSTRPGQTVRGDASGWDAGIYFASGVALQENVCVNFGASAGLDRLRFTLDGQEGSVSDSDPVATDMAPRTRTERNLDDRVGKGNLERGGGSSIISSSLSGRVFLGEMDLARLNDGPYHLAHANAVAQALVAQGVGVRIAHQSTWLPPTASSPTEVIPQPSPPAFILDLCGAWGIAGLLVARLERCADGAPATRVLAVAESDEAAAVLNSIARENGLGPDRYVATAYELVELASRGGVAEAEAAAQGGNSGSNGADCIAMNDHPALATDRRMGANCSGLKAWPSSGSSTDWAMVMASSLVEGSGLLKQGGLADLELCGNFLLDMGGGSGRGRNTLFVPGHLEVICQGLQRASLLSENKVLSNDCCGVDIDPVNAFSVENFRELDLSAAIPCCSSGSSPPAAEAATTSEGKNTEREDFCVVQNKNKTSDGEEVEREAFLTSAIVCYDLDLANIRAGSDGCLDRQFTSLRVECAGTLHAIAYWYRKRLGPELVLDTRPATGSHGGASRFSASSHFRQAAVLLQEPIAVTVGQRIDVCVLCNTSKGVIVQVLGVAEDVIGEVGESMNNLLRSEPSVLG